MLLSVAFIGCLTSQTVQLGVLVGLLHDIGQTFQLGRGAEDVFLHDLVVDDIHGMEFGRLTRLEPPCHGGGFYPHTVLTAGAVSLMPCLSCYRMVAVGGGGPARGRATVSPSPEPTWALMWCDPCQTMSDGSRRDGGSSGWAAFWEEVGAPRDADGNSRSTVPGWTDLEAPAALIPVRPQSTLLGHGGEVAPLLERETARACSIEHFRPRCLRSGPGNDASSLG